MLTMFVTKKDRQTRAYTKTKKRQHISLTMLLFLNDQNVPFQNYKCVRVRAC